MKRLNIYGAFMALAGPGTKEDIIIQVAKQQNIRFNELPQLQKEVDQALEESQRLGFIDRQGTIYKLIMEMPATKSAANKTANNKTANNQTNGERHSRQMNGGQGDGHGKRSHSAVSNRSCSKATNNPLCSACSGMDPKTSPERRKNSNSNPDKLPLPKDTSVCSICGLDSDNAVSPEEQEVDKCVWPNMRNVL